jgi:tripartite-type tricarboxylate transporter receptor subunit TctC
MKPFQRIKFACAGVLIGIFALVSGSVQVRADAVGDFYKGRKGAMIIGSSVGGGYNQYGRLIARHIQKYIPGKPDIVPKNQPGGSGRKALNYVANVAPADGLTLSIIGRNTHFDKLLYEDKSIDVDATKLTWLGSANSEVSLCVSWHSSPIKTLDDAKTKVMTIGASGPTATDTLMARLLNRIAGTKIKPILGYPGSTEAHLAMERGEMVGRCGFGWDSIVSRYYSWITDKKINLLVQLANKKHPDLPNVPFIMDFARNDTEREMLKIFTTPNEMGRPFFARAGIPAGRVKALQKAFLDALNDPKLLAEAKKQNLAITPLSGEETAKLVKEVYSSSPEALSLARAIITSKEQLEKRKENFYTVSATLKSVKKKGRELTFEEKGKMSKAVLTGGKRGTKVTVAGKKGKSTGLKEGMTCDITYEGNLSVAKSVACK